MSYIYVLCPAFIKTGGTELLHQLVYTLNQSSINAKIVFFNEQLGKPLLNPAFNNYINDYLREKDIIDSQDNIIVVPEISIEKLQKYKNIQKIIWWLSVDNFLKNDGVYNSIRILGIKSTIKKILTSNVPKKTRINENDVIHLCQSYYSRNFLNRKGVKKENIYYLSDYINDIYINNKIDISKKQDIVLYNPKKGYKFTKQIIEKSKEMKWIPIQNMSNDEVRDLMIKSKVYIDFGEHPGKDRFPREAAMCGCCIITGMKGAAKFDKDIPIKGEYKIIEKKSNIPIIIEKVKYCVKNYEDEIVKYENYRTFIIGEKDKFKKDTIDIFKKIIKLNEK